MKALFIEQPGSVSYGEIPEPKAQPGEVLLRIDTLGFCGTDLNTYRGRNPLVRYPCLPGHEIGAEVVEVGAEVDAAWLGQLVTVRPFQGCGQCRVCRTGRENCCAQLRVLGVHVPGAFSAYMTARYTHLHGRSKLTFRELALVEPLTIGFHSVARTRVNAEDEVVVLGCGTIGIAAIAGAAAQGAKVLAVDLAEEKFGLAKASGATETLLAQGDWKERVRAWTGGDGPSVVIEAVGSVKTFQDAIDIAGQGARVAYIGWTKQPVEYDASRFVFKELDIVGSRNSSQQFEPVMRYLESGRFPVDLAITQTVSFDDAAEALRQWDAHPESVNKIQVKL